MSELPGFSRPQMTPNDSRTCADPPRRFSLALVWMFTRSSWLWASQFALLLLCAIDCVWPPRPVSFRFVLALVALATPLALLHGLLWSLSFWSVSVLPAWLRRTVVPLVGLSAASWLALRLGTFTRLRSGYVLLAVGVLAACALGVTVFASVWNLFQPSPEHPEGRALTWTRRRRALLGGSLLVAAAGLAISDRLIFPQGYASAHLALRVAALWSLMMAFVACVPPLPALRPTHWVLVLVGYAACVLLLNDQQTGVLDAFFQRPWASGVLAVHRSALDWDHDGYASLLGGGDCAPYNRAIHPGAREIPNNGIDENCILGDAKQRSKVIDRPAPTGEAVPINVVLITVDALTRGHLGIYDADYGASGRATSPNLDRWAQNATVFDHAYSPGGWTSIALPSLLRGVFPRHLSWRKYYETTLFAVTRNPAGPFRPGEGILHMFPFAFDDPHPPLAELLSARGMHCAAVVDDGYSAMLQRGTGIERGFDVFRYVDDLPEEQRNDTGTADLAIAALQQRPAQRRFFLWVHFFGTHWPNEMHAGVRMYGTSPFDLYDHEVLFLDSQLARLLAAIDALKEPTAVVISADHGEGLTKIGRYHGQKLDEGVLRIPLLVRAPGWPSKRVEALAGAIDILPTVLALTATQRPSYLDGVDLATLTRGERSAGRVLFSDTWRFDSNSRIELDFAAAYDGHRQFVLDQVSGALYMADQTRANDDAHLVSASSGDALAAAVHAYLEETGGLVMED